MLSGSISPQASSEDGGIVMEILSHLSVPTPKLKMMKPYFHWYVMGVKYGEREMQRQENGENRVNRSFIIYTFRQVLLNK